MRWTAFNGFGGLLLLAGVFVIKQAGTPQGSVFGAASLYVAASLGLVGLATLVWSNIRAI